MEALGTGADYCEQGTPVVPSFRALSGRLEFMVRRHEFKKDSLRLTEQDLFQISRLV